MFKNEYDLKRKADYDVSYTKEIEICQRQFQT